MVRILAIILAAACLGSSAAFAPLSARPLSRLPSQRRSATGVVSMINRGVKAEDQNCAIKESGMVPVDKPIIFGGGRKYEKDYTFKQVIGHIIPGAFAVAALAPSFMHGSMGSMALPL